MAKLIINIDDDLLNGDIRDIEYAEALDSAISSGVLLPTNATNGDVIKALFPNAEYNKYKTMVEMDIQLTIATYYSTSSDIDWCNAPYEGGENG